MSEQVVGLMLGDPDDQLREATFELIDALTPPGKRIRHTGHVLCQLFEQVALGLQSLLAAPGMVVDELIGETVAGSKVLSAAARVILKHAVQLAMAGSIAPLSLLHLKACVCAVALCPESGKHPSLEKNCSIPIFKAAADQ
ncbi:hypothetical protein QN355_06530 [Cryobacterium sp. 10S3]|uniref:hypothetical protein n=1 Tax=Cryobacterium sp. 10S3 TaxID=3048582 RepID=UPI002AC9C839|nr:hypothetical protein [Cryobacterium sp. 10S3]MEB0286204.1 hypothetical protein [Cryobacterium sp. 10S3]WPX12262.1 hypothetical protein RHM57_11270 [Cryobacterium sp. 10S3]